MRPTSRCACSRPADPALFGRRLTGIAWAFYGAAQTAGNLRRDGRSFNFARHAVIGWDEPARIVASDWIAAHVPRRTHRLPQQQPRESARWRCVRVSASHCCRATSRIATLRVRRISGVLPDLASELWIVTHQDLKNTARIRAFLSGIGDAIVTERRRFEGQS